MEALLQVFQSICLPERLEMVLEQLISGIQDKLGVKNRSSPGLVPEVREE